MNSEQITKLIVGIGFIIVGIGWLGSTLLGIDIPFNLLWPFFVIIPGLFIGFQYLRDPKDWGQVIPATILILVGSNLLITNFISEQFDSEQIWLATAFVYPGSVAAAFWIAFFVSKPREISMMIVASILTAATFITFCFTMFVLLLSGTWEELFSNGVVWAIGLIIIGIFVLSGPFISKLFESIFSEGSQKESKEQNKPEATEAEILEEDIEERIT